MELRKWRKFDDHLTLWNLLETWKTMRFSTFHSTITSMGIFLLIILELFRNIVFRMKDGTHLTSWKLSVEKWTNKSSEYRIRPRVHQKLTKYGHKLQILFAEGDTFLNASDYCRKSLGTKRCFSTDQNFVVL